MSSVRWFRGFIENNLGQNVNFKGVQASAGAANANDVPILNAQGQLDVSFLPASIGAPVKVDTVSPGQTLVQGDFVSFSSNGFKQAIGSSYANRAQAYVRSGAAESTTAVAYLAGINDQVTGLVQNKRYVLSVTNPGKAVAIDAQATYTSGQIRQELGDAMSTSAIYFTPFGDTAVFQ